MRSGLALVGRHLQALRRGRGSRIALVAGVLALGVVFLATQGPTHSTTLLASFVVIGMLAFGAAAWAGALLPADRAEGREAWLATLAPSSAARRVAAAATGMLLAVVVAVAGGALLAVLLPDLEVRAHREVDLPEPVRLGVGGRAQASVVLDLGDALAAPATLQVVVAPLYFGWGGEAAEDATRLPLELDWRFEGAAESGAGSAVLARGAPLAIAAPAGARRVVLSSGGQHVHVVVKSVRVLGDTCSPLLTLVLAGLVLGVAAAAVAPVAVAVSRWTSAPTATAAALVLAVAGGLRFLLPDLAMPDAGRLHQMGLAVLRAAAHLAPDLEVLGRLGDPAAGRALSLPGLGGLLHLALYALLALVLVAWPTRSEPARGRTS